MQISRVIQPSLILMPYPHTWCMKRLHQCLIPRALWHRQTLLLNRTLLHILQVAEVGTSFNNVLSSRFGIDNPEMLDSSPQSPRFVHLPHDPDQLWTIFTNFL
ncbi:unnamed protein product [Hymenolepis diminuta]|uniref:Uncharacterized protein n=1 Tax=Hymenolepis diminuta TaxID=6216 RepID=A0A564YT38_HYMDI|nr:unnamed protein product [Hymenolepis diminuta]